MGQRSIRSDLGGLKGYLIRPDCQLPCQGQPASSVDQFLIISLWEPIKMLAEREITEKPTKQPPHNVLNSEDLSHEKDPALVMAGSMLIEAEEL
ncbi:hypothetical protein FGO68_gene10288 [Halteria grandinella]|uniref:Uncharacterized protein n=1 Tax=Halteria grandinella TaxID=5974 RepID=A0A8J8NYS2_HALGN|nr:hypothetical protein FGO68_gene10288 [Halteria grandinella]